MAKHKIHDVSPSIKPRIGETWEYRGCSIAMRGMRGQISNVGKTFIWCILTVHPGSPGTLTWKSTMAVFLQRWIRVGIVTTTTPAPNDIHELSSFDDWEP